MKYKLRPIMKELYISDKGEVKSVKEWIEFAHLHGAVISEQRNVREVEIYTGTENSRVTLKTITKY